MIFKKVLLACAFTLTTLAVDYSNIPIGKYHEGAIEKYYSFADVTSLSGTVALVHSWYEYTSNKYVLVNILWDNEQRCALSSRVEHNNQLAQNHFEAMKAAYIQQQVSVLVGYSHK